MFKSIAQRSLNAENRFIDSVIEQFEFNKSDAEKILSVFMGHKIIKIDPIMGQYKLTQGIYWDKQVMDNALEQFNDK